MVNFSVQIKQCFLRPIYEKKIYSYLVLIRVVEDREKEFSSNAVGYFELLVLTKINIVVQLPP